MLFGKPSSRRPRPSSSTRRQLISMGVLLGILLVLSSRLAQWSRKSAPDTPPLAAPVSMERDEVGEVEIELAPRAGDPGSPLPGAGEGGLDGLARSDRTSAPSERGLKALFQQILGDRQAFRAAEPVLGMTRRQGVQEALIERPDEYRGKLVDVVGNIVARDPGRAPLRLMGLRDSSGLPTDRWFESYLMDGEGKLYLVATIEKAKELENLDPVHLRGYFLHLYTNDVEYQGRLRKATIPILVGLDYETLELPTTGSPNWSGLWLVLAIGGAGILVVLLISPRSSRPAARRSKFGGVPRSEPPAAKESEGPGCP